MRRLRRIMVIALASGILAFLIVPFLIPFESSGTLSAREAAGPRAEFITVMGQEVHVETAAYTGSPVAEPPLVILLHGFGASTFSWREVIGPLAELGDVLAYDRVGFGFTERPMADEGVGAYGIPGNLEMLDALLAANAPAGRDVILIGHSAGGQLAAEYARTRPEAVDRLILVSPAIYTTGGLPDWLRPVLSVPQIERLGPILVGGLASSGDQLLRQSFVDQSALTPEVIEGYRRPLSVIGWEEGLWRFTSASRDNDLLANLSTVRLPVLLITGDTDTVIPTADTERLATALPSAQLVVIPRAGHLAHEERPEAFLDAVTAWMATSGT